MTGTQTGAKPNSKLAQSLRRAKTQQTADTSAPVTKPAAKVSPRKKAAAASVNKSSLVLTSRCWPD